MALWNLFRGALVVGALAGLPAAALAQDGDDKAKPESPAPGDTGAKPKDGGETKPGETKPGDTKPGERPNRGARGRGPYNVDDLKTKIGLNEDQEKKVRAAIDAFSTSMREKMKNATDRRAAMQEGRAELDKQIEALLDDGQKAKFADYKKEHAQGQRGGRPGGSGAPPAPKDGEKKEGEKKDGEKPADPPPSEPH